MPRRMKAEGAANKAKNVRAKRGSTERECPRLRDVSGGGCGGGGGEKSSLTL